MRTIISILTTCLIITQGYSQYSLSGKITDRNGKALPQVLLVLDQSRSTMTDASGFYAFKEVKEGEHLLKISYFNTVKEIDIQVHGDIRKAITLNLTQTFDEIIVRGTRAQYKTPMTFTEIGKQAINTQNVAVDASYVMKWTPSAVVSSDAGAGVGYTGIRIRGSDATRINITINGIPFNDPESQEAYWVDIPDILGSADNIQIQRGVGTSSQGAAAFGATINVNTLKPELDPFGRIDMSYGSYNTKNVRLRLGTGLIKDKFYLESRLSHTDSDGYVDRATSNLNSYYISAGYQGDMTSVKLEHFTGKERTYQSWFGLPAQYVDIDSLRTYNAAGQEKVGKPYENQVDDYLQSHTQLHIASAFSDKLTAKLSLHYTYGSGYYEEYEADEAFSDYGISPLILSDDTIRSTDLVRRRWLDNDFYGAIASIQYKPNDRIELVAGGGWSNYLGNHYGEVIWARFASNTENPFRYYFNDARKQDFNLYAKSLFTIVPSLIGFVDLQYRQVRYNFQGIDRNGDQVRHTVNLPFFNPKIGLTYLGLQNQKLYLSAAIAHREPNRDDYVESPIEKLPEAEKMLDIEAGYQLAHEYGYFHVNSYAMLYKNQLILTGEINDVGEYPRINVDDSYRIGIEMSSSTEILPELYFLAGGTISRNRIKEFHYFMDNWKTGGQILRSLSNTHIAFSPDLLLQGGLSYRMKFEGDKYHLPEGTDQRYLDISLMTKYVGKQYLDNTSFDESLLPAYNYTDLQVVYNQPLKNGSQLRFNFKISNLFNQKYITNGWIYRFMSPESYLGEDPYRVLEQRGENINIYSQRGFFPQALIHYYMTISMIF